MNKKIRNYSALALAAVAVIPAACKKSDGIIDDTTDDPNIKDTTLSKVFTGVGTPAAFTLEDSIDVDNNGTFDFDIYV